MIDDPSPLLSLLPAELLTKSHAGTLQPESDMLDQLCFVAFLRVAANAAPPAVKAGDEKLRRQEEKKKADLRRLYETFEARASLLEEDDDSILLFWREMRALARANLRGQSDVRGLLDLPPALTTTTTTGEAVATWALRAHEEHARRVLPLWVGGDTADGRLILRAFRMLPTLLCHEVARHRRPSLELLMESLVLQHYLAVKYASLHPAKKADPAQPAVRRMFWAAMFQFRQRQPLTILDDAEELRLERRRGELFREVRDCLGRIDHAAARVRRLEALPPPPPESTEAAVLGAHLAALRLSEPHGGRLRPSPAELQECALAGLVSNVFYDAYRAGTTTTAKTKSSHHHHNHEEPQAARSSTSSHRRNLDALLEGAVLSDERLFREEEARLALMAATDAYDDDDDEAAVLLVAAAEQRQVEDAVLQRVEAELLAQAIAEAQADRDAEARVLANLATTRAGFARAVLAHFCPDIVAGFLDGEQECFICLAPLAFEEDQQQHAIRYLTCCDGGAFACAACVEQHAARAGHPVRAEARVVALVATLRRSLGGSN